MAKNIRSSKQMARTGQHYRASVASIKQRASKVWQWLYTLPVWIYGHLTRLGLWTQQRASRVWAGDQDEDAKEVISKYSAWKIFNKIVVHLPPIAAAVVLLALNFNAAFIGNEMLGWNFGSWQDFYKLCLQVTAKVHELCIVASLSTVIMDIVRHELLQGSNGLPLGILTAKTQFMDALYLTSPDFRHGICGIVGYKRILFGLFIMICTAISLLAGPSSALLLIPETHDQDWSAGGAQFQLRGSHDDFWPSQLDDSFVGGEHCRVPQDSHQDRPLQPKPDTASCIWAGYEAMTQWWVSSHVTKKVSQIPMQDGGIRKMIHFRYSNHNHSVCAITVPLAPCTYSNTLGDLWLIAAATVPSAKPGTLSKFQNYVYRNRVGSKVTIESEMPVVWTTCLTNDSVTYADVVDKTHFPLQFEYPEYRSAMLAHNNSVDEGQILGTQLSFNTTMYASSSRVAAIWLETPTDQRIGTRFDQSGLSGRSSAYLNLQIPSSNGTSGFLASCAIDARWHRSAFISSGAAQTLTDPLYEPQDLPAIQRTGQWRPVRLRSSWLNTLTPDLGSTDGEHWNTLSSIITELGFTNTTSIAQFRNVTDTSISPDSYISAVVSAVVADGMSRTGFENNGGDGKILFPWSRSYSVVSDMYGDLEPLLEGDYQLRPPPSVKVGTSEGYPMQWKIAISGLGYRVNGAPYYIASTILLTHVTIALCHIAWVIQTRQTSTAWSSLHELVILAFKSPPPGPALDNASAGVTRYVTYQERLSIQAVSKTPGPDGVEMVLNSDIATPARHHPVAPEVRYR